VVGVEVRVGAWIAFEDGNGFVEADPMLAKVGRGFAWVELEGHRHHSTKSMAEGEGFEPPAEFPPRRFSRPEL
jgi:hypothetical protein